jgi:hypothetical protein
MANIEIKNLKDKLPKTFSPRDLSSQEILLIKGGRWVNKPDTACWKEPQIWVY